LPKNRRKTLDGFQSYIPKYIQYDDLPPALCYGDIDLFVIQNPEGGSDVVVTVIDFAISRGPSKALKLRSKDFLKQLGRDAGYDIPINHIAFRQ